MLRLFYPDCYVEDVFSIDYEKLMAMGFKALILDIDNTLVPHGDDSTPVIDDLFNSLHAMGWKTLLLSNNNRERIERFMSNFNSLYIEEAGKPSSACYHHAVEMLGVEPKAVVVIGDQVFTDILGANRAGLSSILVKYIGYYKKEKKGIRRNLEKVVLWFYRYRKPKLDVSNNKATNNTEKHGKEA